MEGDSYTISYRKNDNNYDYDYAHMHATDRQTIMYAYHTSTTITSSSILFTDLHENTIIITRLSFHVCNEF